MAVDTHTTLKNNGTNFANQMASAKQASALMTIINKPEKNRDLANELSGSSAREAMKFSASEAQKNRDWQEYMSNTSYQRAVKDMMAAGINPILAYSQGGASTPGGAQGTGYAYTAQQEQLTSKLAILESAVGIASILGGNLLNKVSKTANKVFNQIDSQMNTASKFSKWKTKMAEKYKDKLTTF